MKIMKNIPLVSIVVPIYKTEKYIKQCVDSLINQTYENLEIILIDDGSPDKCPQICDKYEKQDSRITVIHKKNAGAAAARETGIHQSHGEYMMFVDGDDWLDLSTVKKCVCVAEEKNVECVLFSYVKEYANKSICNFFWDSSFYCDEVEAEDKVHRRLIGLHDYELIHPEKIDNLVSFCMKLYKTEVAKKGLIVDEKNVGTSEDTLFNIYALDGCKSLYCLNECLYHYRRTNSGSITMNYKKNLADKWDVLYAYFEGYFEKTETKEKYREVFLNRVCCGTIGLGINEVCSNHSIFESTKNIKRILKKPLYREAFQKLNIKYCPIKWKLFFILCKLRLSFALTVLLMIMNYLRSRVSG